MNEHRIVPLEKHHLPTAINALSLAFIDDPIMAILEPNERKREKMSPWFWRSTLIYGMRWGVAETDESGRSAAVWLPPGNSSLPLHRILRTPFIQLPFRIGLRGMLRFAAMDSAIQKAQARQVPGPHWHLLALAVHPDLQGTGIGSAYMRRGHERADEAGVPCYLETGTQEDIDFYSKRGYTVGETIQVRGFDVSVMLRQPVPSAGPAVE